MANQTDVEAVLMGLFALAAGALGPHWEIQPREARAIAEPLTRIINRMDFGEQATKYADIGMLLMVLLPLLGVRIMITVQMKKAEKQKEGQTLVIQTEGEKPGGTDTRRSLPTAADDVPPRLVDLLPAVG